MAVIESIEQLETIYGRLEDVGEASTANCLLYTSDAADE